MKGGKILNSKNFQTAGNEELILVGVYLYDAGYFLPSRLKIACKCDPSISASVNLYHFYDLAPLA
jgi:hypothetical protein